MAQAAGPPCSGLQLLLAAADTAPACRSLAALLTPRAPAGAPAGAPACSAAAVRAAGGVLRCQVGERRVPVAVFALSDGGWAALHDSCPHSSMSLAGGAVDARKGLVRCKGHGLGFCLRTGQCDMEDMAAPTFAVEERGEELLVDVSRAANGAPNYDAASGRVRYQ
eukprot:TRINITY_DN51099_c0_g1_i1.p1 TRINITY_DN51099_c0_g1~~TRINITY_DN51099_c0_g1_i1.p1  ORF type:complete len:188 (+),score=48.74 TRINITY_DN51099_c0_g1_i1:69-566(+)